MSPAGTECFDIFSPLPGDNDVINQFERLSSNETKIAAYAGHQTMPNAAHSPQAFH
jgi:hypothetical protein